MEAGPGFKNGVLRIKGKIKKDTLNMKKLRLPNF